MANDRQTTMDENGIITSGSCKPGCGATVGYAHKMSCSQGTGKGLRLSVSRRWDPDAGVHRYFLADGTEVSDETGATYCEGK